MRMPATSVHGNIVFTEHGTAWALWRLSPSSHGHSTDKAKQLAHAAHQVLFRGLVGESLLLGLATTLDPADTIERTLADVDLESAPQAVAEAGLALEALEVRPMGERLFWLAVPLGSGGPLDRTKAVAAAVQGKLSSFLGLPLWAPSEKTLLTARTAADIVERAIPAEFHPMPAPATDFAWIADHMQLRGLGLDFTPSPGTDGDALMRGAGMSEPWIDEGGQSDQDGAAARMNPMRRRFLKISHVSEEVSYQTMLALTTTPKGGFLFPGVELLRVLDTLPVDADFAIRLNIRKASAVLASNRRAERNILDQYVQREGEATTITGSGAELDEQAELLAAYSRALRAAEGEVEVNASVILAVGGPDPETARQKAAFISDFYARAEFRFEAPLGAQEKLWWAMIPGTPSTGIVSETGQITTGRDFAMGLPITSAPLGSDTGFLLGENISTGRPGPVLMSIGGVMEKDLSGSFGVVGENGSGKSTTLKVIAGHTFDRDGLLVVVDRSDNQEWATFARSLDQRQTTVLDVVAPKHTLDPLRLFTPREARRMILSLFTHLFGIRPNSEEGGFLGLMLAEDYMEAHAIGSLSALRKHLAGTDGLPGENPGLCRALAGRISTIAATDYGAVLFDSSLPPLPLDRRATVFCTHGLDLPSREELLSPSLKADMSLEKVFGRALYALLAAIGHDLIFADDSQEALFLVDECHHMTSSPEGEREISDVIRFGRKHKAAVGLGSHDALHDFGSEALRGLIPTRLVFRTRDRTLAENNVHWLGEVDFESAVHTVTRDLSPAGTNDEVPADRRGECLMRDVRNRIGRVRVLLPFSPDRAKAVLTTPPRADRAPGGPRLDKAPA